MTKWTKVTSSVVDSITTDGPDLLVRIVGGAEYRYHRAAGAYGVMLARSWAGQSVGAYYNDVVKKNYDASPRMPRVR